MIKTKIVGTGGNEFRVETVLPHGRIPTNQEYIQGAKAICELLLGGIPSATFDEVVAFLRAYERHPGMASFTDEFQQHFVRRLNRLNKNSDG